MDDDGSKSLNFEEFQKGLHDYGINVDKEVSLVNIKNIIVNSVNNICFTF